MSVPPVVSSGHRNYFLPLTLIYLISPSLLFLVTWINPLIGLPAALIGGVGLFQLLRSPDMYASRPRLSGMHWGLVFSLALIWSLLGGVGGFLPQSADYIKHGLLFHDLITQPWPVHYTLANGEQSFLCYGLGYYIFPALLTSFLGDALFPGLVFLWTFAGIFLFLYWVATCGPTPRKALFSVLFFAVTGILWMLFKQRGLFHLIKAERLTEKLLQLGLFFSYNDSFTRFQYQPQHALPGWLGATVFYELLWVRKKPRAVFFIWVACVMWSPLSSLGILVVPLAALKRISWKSYFEPINFIGGLWLLIIGAYYKAHAAINDSGFIWKYSQGAEWLIFYGLFLLLELSPIFLIWLADRKYKILKDQAPLFYIATGYLILLPLYKLGFNSDLRLEASGPAMLFVALAAVACWQSPAFSFKRPLFLFMTAAVLIGAIYPVMRPLENLMSNTVRHTYPEIVQSHGFRNLSELREINFDASQQYLGQTNSLAGRWLLRH